VPPLIENTTLAWPDGTVSWKNVCAPDAPDRLGTGTLLTSAVVVSASKVASRVTPAYAVKPLAT